MAKNGVLSNTHITYLEAGLNSDHLHDRETIAISDNSAGREWLSDLQLNLGQTREARASTLRQLFPLLLPARPYCADDLKFGLQILSRAKALEKLHIQLNGPSSFRWMCHDIDHPHAYFAHRDAIMPQPNVIAINPRNGHGHSAVLLSCPVARHASSRIEPLRFFGAVERGIARRVGADRNYVGLVAKNPLHDRWRVEWRREEPYTLTELADWLVYDDMRPDPTVETTLGVGRNCVVFDELRTVAYREVRDFKRDCNLDVFRVRLEHVAFGINQQFPIALGQSEVRAIAKSVANWTWRHFTEEKFSQKQALRGARRAAQMWAGHTSTESTKPWLAEDISRATWYRRRRAASPTTSAGEGEA
jgi:Replicase family/Primase C terminal 1 (PriCT-1)